MEKNQQVSVESSQPEDSKNKILSPQPQKIVPPVGIMTKIYCNHFGRILSNLTMTAAVAALLCFLSSLITVLVPAAYFLLLLIMTLFSLGTVFVTIPNFVSWWSFDINIVTRVSVSMLHAIPYLCAIAMATAIASTVLLLVDKNNRSWGRVTFSIIFFVVSVAIVLIWALGGVK